MAYIRERIIPPAAQTDPNAVEILRAWIAHKGMHVSLLPSIWQDSSSWGIALADIIRHLADAYRQTDGTPLPDTVGRILASLHREFDSPTDTPEGGFVDRPPE